MNRKDAKVTAELAVRLVQHGRLSYKSAPEIADVLIGMAQRLNRYNEADCNYGLNPAQEKRAANLFAKISKILVDLGLDCAWRTDPRGYAVRIFWPDGEYNTWGGTEDGYGI